MSQRGEDRVEDVGQSRRSRAWPYTDSGLPWVLDRFEWQPAELRAEDFSMTRIILGGL
jgi:hypothetical protein